MSRYLVTGGTGFLGGAMVNRLLKAGHKVVVVDNMFDPTFRMLTEQRNHQLQLHTIDVRDLDSLLALEGEFDAVFHYAAHYANTRSLAEPMLNVGINMLGTMAILEFCRQKAVKKLVYASSSGVYGAMDIVAYSENQPPQPSTPYEVTKYAGELLCDGYCKIYGISLVAPRFFNVYGPGDVPGNWRAVIPMFFQLAKNHAPMIVTGKNVSRDFTYIDDVIEGTLAGLDRLEEAPDRISLVYNIGTGQEVFIANLAKKIKEFVSGSNSEIMIEGLRSWDNAPRRVADCHKYQALFPKQANSMRKIDQGLKDATPWYLDVC